MNNKISNFNSNLIQLKLLVLFRK